MNCPMNTTLALVLQTKARATKMESKMIDFRNVWTIRRTPATTVRGKTQYPSTQTDWKKDIVPPSNWALMVTIAAPLWGGVGGG